MKTLYLSDLDGTLLRDDASLTRSSRDTLGRLIAQGMHFSVATARNTLSVTAVTGGLRLRVPVSLMNGAVCYDTDNDRYFAAKGIPPESFRKLIHILRRRGMTGFAYAITANTQTLCYESPTNFQLPARQYYEKRLRDKLFAPQSVRLSQMERLEDIADECVCMFSIKETYETLRPVRDELQAIEGIYAPFYKDKYTDFWFIEAASANASKAAAVADLKAWGSFDRVVGFGDDINDIPMLEACDEAYAVANAAEAVKRVAHGVVGSNEEDGVANYLAGRFGE